MSVAVMSMELSQSLARSGVLPLYAVVGEEDYLRDHSIAILREAALGEALDSGFNYDVFHGDDSSIEEVLGCAAEIPVFAARRVIVYKSVEKLPAREGEKLLSYLSAPNETTTLIVAGAKLDGRLKWTQALAKRAVTVTCAPLRDAQLAAWIRQEAAALGVRIHDEAAQLLKEAGNESLYAVRRELEKLAAYVPPDRIVQSADVEALRGTEPGASVFDLMSAIGAHDHGRSLRILARNVENGEAPLRILGALVWQYRRLWKTKEQLQVRWSGRRSSPDASDGPRSGGRVSGTILRCPAYQGLSVVYGNRLEAQRGERQYPCSRDGRPFVSAMRPPTETSAASGTGADDNTGPSPGRFETGVEYQNGYAEAVMAFTRTVSLDTRREAVFGFRTPLVTALLSAAVASRKVAFASSGFLAVIASWTLRSTLRTELSVARLRKRRFSD